MRPLAGAIALAVVAAVATVLYLTGPERRCTVYTEIGPTEREGSRLACLRSERNSAWERLSGAITGD